MIQINKRINNKAIQKLINVLQHIIIFVMFDHIQSQIRNKYKHNRLIQELKDWVPINPYAAHFKYDGK